MLVSTLGTAVSQIALGLYFYSLAQPAVPFVPLLASPACPQDPQLNLSMDSGLSMDPGLQSDNRSSSTALSLTWLPLLILILFTVSFNLGLGSLTWVVATEILPAR